MALARRKFWFSALAGVAFLWAAGPLGAAIGDRVVSDRHTGLAIFGYDPVAYFVDAKPVAGKAEFEFEGPDAIWRFRSAGNKAAFMANPDVYRPRYGGYDPIALGRGIALAGNPLIWLMTGDRLYFFYTQQARDTFRLDPETAITAADDRWPTVVQSLAR